MSNEGIMSELNGEDTPYNKLTIKMFEEALEYIQNSRNKSKDMTATFFFPTRESYDKFLEEYRKEFKKQLENYNPPKSYFK